MRLPFIRVSYLVLGLLSFTALPTQAELSVNVGIASEYVREGISHTDGSPAYQGGINWLHNNGLYLGVWGSRLKDRNSDLKHELDAFAGFYWPVSENISLDMAITQFNFYGDDNAFWKDYHEYSVSALFYQRTALNFRTSPNYLGTGHTWQAINLSYVVPIKGFNLELYVGNYHWLDKDKTQGASYGDKSHYWHFRIGVERSWNNWDYRVAFERGMVSNGFDDGSKFTFGITRHFKLIN